MTSPPVVQFHNLTKMFPPDTTALQAVSLSFYAGEFAFLVGPSGSGKSTLLRMVNRSEQPTSGALVIAGRDVAGIRRSQVPHLRRRVACIFQDFKLLERKTAGENVAFALEVTGHPRAAVQARTRAALSLVGLDGKADRRPAELSGGEQQRVSIARAVAGGPAVLLADEPTGNLDPDNSRDIVHLLHRISGTGTTVLMATHDRGIVNDLAQRVVELDGGQVVRDEARGGYAAPAPSVAR